jgi:hypothetical protein
MRGGECDDSDIKILSLDSLKFTERKSSERPKPSLTIASFPNVKGSRISEVR